MGVLKRGIFGGFTGKIGNLVGAQWKGIDTVRAYQATVSNPNTVPQQNQRQKFKAIQRLAGQILIGWIHPLYNVLAQRKSGYNLFISRILAQYPNAGNPGWGSLQPSPGKLPPVVLTSATRNGGTNVITITWNKSQETEIPLTATLVALVTYGSTDTDPDTEFFSFNQLAMKYDDETATVTLPKTPESVERSNIFVSFRTIDGKKSSISAKAIPA